jgi:gamma-glutamylaminecyclotransferase
MTARHFVFVYGTLMRAGHHHDVMQGARFLRAAQTLPEYELVYIEYYPALLRGGSTSVVGEVYEVDAATLARLDELEEVPSYYLRERILLADGSEAETYVMPRERVSGAEPIASGDFRAYSARRKPS